MHIRALALAGIALVCSASAPAKTDLPTADDILKRYTEALGGEAAVARVKNRVLRGCYLPTRETPCIRFEAWSASPEQWKTVTAHPGITRFDRIGAEAGLAFNALVLLRPAEHIRDLAATAPGTLAGKWQDKQVELAFDAGTGLLSRVGDFALSEYRPVDGVQVPFLIERRGTRYVIHRAEQNIAFDADLFKPEHSDRRGLASRRAALDECLRGIEVTPAERKTLEELEAFSPLEGRMLFDLVRQRGYKRALEIGTGWGNSSIWLAMALKRNGGQLVTVDKEAQFSAKAREHFTKAGLEDAIENRVADAFAEIPRTGGEWDLVFIDTGTNLHKALLDLVRPRVRPGGAIISHNADTFERDQPDFRKAVMEDPALETSLVLTPGGGMSISLLRPAM